VLIASRTAPERTDLLRECIGESVETHAFDITTGNPAALFERTGAIDHLVVAVRPRITPAPFAETDLDEAKRAFDTKFWGVCGLIQAARPVFGPRGSITLTSGIAGEKIYPGASVMSVINSATETLCRVLAVELAPLRINAVSPGQVAPKPPAVEEQARRFPLGRVAGADVVAEAYVFLMENAYITGTVTVVDGGARLV
jgi:NAD(P)-dependent dehydrogenase (short-subunit alcohol dehydrogenase family)